jgi:molybdenum cofactor cytidylyltransferase
LAPIGGRPLLQHVLDALAAAGVSDVVVVLGADAGTIEAAIDWRAERRVVNPDPERGLSSSLALGFETIGPDAGSVLVALGDQPLVSVEVIRALLDGPGSKTRPIVVPAYTDERGRNPVLVGRAAFDLVGEATGDRGLGPVLEAHPDLVAEIAVDGANPDVDTRVDHARAIEAAWAARVRANRDQVERIREVPDGTDFYAPVNSLFRADPTRTDDDVLDALLRLTRSGDTWLDIGAGAGRFALPIARALDPSGGSVIALDASPSMPESLGEVAEDYAIENVRVVAGRWPPAPAWPFSWSACRLRRRTRSGRPSTARSGSLFQRSPTCSSCSRRVAGARTSGGWPSSRAGSGRAKRSKGSSGASSGSIRPGQRKSGSGPRSTS